MSRLGRIASALTMLIQSVWALVAMSRGSYLEASARLALCVVVALAWIIILLDKDL